MRNSQAVDSLHTQNVKILGKIDLDIIGEPTKRGYYEREHLRNIITDANKEEEKESSWDWEYQDAIECERKCADENYRLEYESECWWDEQNCE